MARLTQKDYRLIHSFVAKYGSLAKTPDGVLQRTLWKKFGEEEETKRMETAKQFKFDDVAKTKVDKVDLAKMIVMFKRGYGYGEIAFQSGRGYNTVYRRLKQAGYAKPIGKFDMVKKVDNVLVYSNWRESLARLLGYSQRTSEGITKAELGKYKNVKYCNYRWDELPESVVYVTKHGVFIKHGLESYESEDWRYDEFGKSKA